MNRDSRICVAGHRGLIGAALVHCLQAQGYQNLLLRTHAELDLTNQSAVRNFFAAERPEYVFLAAAKVGGILANATHPADFVRENLLIQTHVIHEAYRSGVERLLFLGSSCIYPRGAQQPLREECLLTGPLEATNRPYAVAKIAGTEMCWSYNRQHGTRFLAAMPTNLYGPGDRYDPHDSHVIPALIRKMHEVKVRGSGNVAIWGTGTPRREFLYSEDAADACVFLMNLPDENLDSVLRESEVPPLINIGCGEDLTVRELAELIAEVIGIKKQFVFDQSKPDGTPQKRLDVSRLRTLGWKPQTPLREGLIKTYQQFLENSTPACDLRPISNSLG